MSAPHPIPESTIIERASEQVSTAIADEIVLLGLRNSRYFGLDGVGADVWRWLSEPHSFEALVSNVLAHYDVERTAAVSDLTVFLRELEAEGLIALRPEA